MNCFGGVWQEERLGRAGPKRKKGIIRSVDGGEKSPDSVHLGYVTGEEGQDICDQCHFQTELDWPDE